MKTTSIVVCAGMAATLCAGCSGRPAANETRTVPAAAVPAASHAPAPAAASASPNPRPPAAQNVTGTVLETMDASNYTYVRVKTDSGELWAAASRFKSAVGDTVIVSLDQPMENFHSQALKRDFPLIYFVSQIGAANQAPTSAAQAAPVAKAIEPAKDGTTVAALWTSRASLAGKSVTVRGKVVKFNGGILGVNWIHLQDGTGSADDGSNDITVTSDMDAQVGDIVTATGVVALNKDLGSGYKYAVIIEHARLDRK